MHIICTIVSTMLTVALVATLASASERASINKRLARESLTTSIKHYLGDLYKALDKAKEERVIRLPLRNLSNQVSLYLRLGGNIKDLNLTSGFVRAEYGSFKNPPNLVVIGTYEQSTFQNLLLGPVDGAFVRIESNDGSYLLYNFNPLRQNTLKRAD